MYHTYISYSYIHMYHIYIYIYIEGGSHKWCNPKMDEVLIAEHPEGASDCINWGTLWRLCSCEDISMMLKCPPDDGGDGRE